MDDITGFMLAFGTSGACAFPDSLADSFTIQNCGDSGRGYAIPD